MKPLFAAYLVALHVALVGLAVHDELPQRVGVKLGLLPPPVDVHAEAIHEGLIRDIHVPRDQQAPAGSVVFLGDSITEMLLVSTVAPNAVNHGISGQTSAELLRSMDRYPSLQHASAVVVMTGTNDLNEGRAAGIENRYRAILTKIPPTVPVVLSSIPPNAHHDARTVVEAARAACSADPRCTFVDAFSALSVPDAQRRDGIHLTAKGYAIWTPMLRGALTAPRCSLRDSPCRSVP